MDPEQCLRSVPDFEPYFYVKAPPESADIFKGTLQGAHKTDRSRQPV